MAKVTMYTTLVCPYCVRAKQLLKARGVDSIEEIRIDLDPAQRDAMMSRTGRRTVPQIYIGDTHVGGCDDLMLLDQRGGLGSRKRGLQIGRIGLIRYQLRFANFFYLHAIRLFPRRSARAGAARCNQYTRSSIR